MIEQLARVLAKVLFNKKQGNTREAADEVESAFKNIIGFDYITISAMSVEDLISLLTFSKESASAKCIIAGKLFKERTEIKEITNIDESEITAGYQKSLNLFIEGMLKDEDPSSNEFSGYYSDIDVVINKLKNKEIPAGLRFRLFKYYGLTGKYAKAEDELFRLKDLNYDNIQQAGTQFYNGLEKLSEAKLREGNFSKEEVLQGMIEFSKRKTDW